MSISEEKKEYSNHQKKLIGEQAIAVGIETISETLKEKFPEKFPNFQGKVNTVLQNPDPVLEYFFDMHQLRQSFCKYQNITVETLQKLTAQRKIFIAVIVKLYYPAFITGYRNDLMDRLAKELSRALNCQREFISQQHDYIKEVLSTDNWKTANYYQADRKVIEELVEKMGSEVVKPKSEGNVGDMFSNKGKDVEY